MDEKIQSIKRICDAYLKNAESGVKSYSAASWWNGYHTGQKKLAERILEAINTK